MKGRSAKKYVCCLAVAAVLLAGGCAAPQIEEEVPETDAEGNLSVGTVLTVAKPDDRLELLESNSALAAQGMYYATWVAGESEPYENSDGETVDLYDAQLYLLLEDADDTAKAGEDMEDWLEQARDNYEVSQEEQISCGGQDYTAITYTCRDPDSPYDRGVSAFAAVGDCAVCIELTCVEDYEDDLRDLLTGFLECCTYSTDN